MKNAQEEEINLERLGRIHRLKLEFCDKKSLTNKSLMAEEPDLIKKFVPKEVKDVKVLAKSVLDGTYDLKAEDIKLKELITKLNH